MASIHADTTSRKLARQVAHDVPDSYAVEDGFAILSETPVGRYIEDDGRPYRVGALSRVQEEKTTEEPERLLDTVPLFQIDGGDIQPVDHRGIEILLEPGVLLRPSPVTAAVHTGSYDHLLQPEEQEPISPYHNGTTPVSRNI